MNIGNYQMVIPQIKELVSLCREKDIPIFYTEAIREPGEIGYCQIYKIFLPDYGSKDYKTKRYQYVLKWTWNTDN